MSDAGEDEPVTRRRFANLPTTLCVAAVIIVFDQLSKWWAVERLGDGEVVDVMGGLVFRLTYNTGTAFSLGSGRNLGPVVFLLALGLVVALILSGTTDRRTGAVTVGLVAGGAVGNLIDRALRTSTGDGLLGGGVVDFVDLGWWPVFNVADAAIVVGALSLVAINLIGPGRE